MDVDFDVFCPAEDVFVCGEPGQPEAFLLVYLLHERHRFVVDSCCCAVEFFACLTQVSWYGEFVGSYHTCPGIFPLLVLIVTQLNYNNHLLSP